MGYKLIAFDLDDTLMNSKGSISDVNITALRRAKDAGIKLVMSTGRMFSAILRYAKILEYDGPVITFGGARIIDIKTGEILYSRIIDKDLTRDVLDYAKKFNVYAQVYNDESFLFERSTEQSEYYARMNAVEGIETGDFEKLIIDTPKILIIDKPDKIREILPPFRDRYAGRLAVGMSKPIYLEINNPEATKSAALAKLCELYGITREEVMAIGDGLIDISMMEYAGLGVAVGNADGEVLKRADVVVGTNDCDGVAEAIEKFVFG